MKEFLYAVMNWIALVHDAILRLNDRGGACLNDKELHFLVIGLLGMLGVLVIYPLFRWLCRRGRVLTLVWIYVFSLVLGLTFAIEIGQKISGTGTMSFADIVSGVLGFLYMFAVFALIRVIIRLFGRLRRESKKTEGTKQTGTAQ
ncbi:MAG: hypothetical protein IKI69_00060 [Oscillospiraceae bacterium]|nr:hypothetical protein [Oscillospiraceae bacterium]